MSSRSTKYILGGLALAGGSLYLYDQQVKLAAEKRRVQHEGVLLSFGSNKGSDGRDLRAVGADKGYQIGDLLENLKQKANRKLDELEVPSKVNSAISDIEQKRSEAAGVVAQQALRLQGYALEHADKHDAQSQYLHEEAHKNDPNFLQRFVNKLLDKIDEAEQSVIDSKNRVVNGVDQLLNQSKNFVLRTADKYIDSVNEVGIAAANTLYGAKDLVEDAAHTTRRKVDSAAQNLEAEKNGWLRWGSAKTEEAKRSAEQTKEDAKQTGRLWFSWGKENTDAARDEAVAKYNRAKLELEKARKEANSSGKLWLNWGDKKTDELSAELQQKLREAERNVNDSLLLLRQYGRDFVSSITGGSHPSGLTEEELARRLYNALRGWGESAQDFAEDELRAIDSYNTKYPHGANWADETWTKSENLLRHAYDRAKENYDQLAREAEAHKNKALSWFKQTGKDVDQKSDELSKEASKKLDEAKVQLDKALANFSLWLSKSGKTLADYTEDAIGATKKGLNIGNDQVQKGLSEGQEWVSKQK